MASVVVLSEADKLSYVSTMSDEVRNEIMSAVEEALASWSMGSEEFQQAWGSAFNSRVCDLDGAVKFEFVAETLSYYVVENLRNQQDHMPWVITRYDNLQQALQAYEATPREYTAALGLSMTGGPFGVGEYDLVHRKNGDSVLVTDYQNAERWNNNPLVHRAVTTVVGKLDIQYVSDCQTFGGKTVLTPLNSLATPTLNSYYRNKYLRPQEGTEHLNSSINEVLLGGVGWISGEEFFKRLNAIHEYDQPERLKVMRLNVNYVDLDGRWGQTDILPSQYRLLKQQTVERTAAYVDVEDRIDEAEMAKKDLGNEKEREELER